MLSQIPRDEPIACVSGGGAYDTKACHAAFAHRQAQAVMLPRKNAKPWKETLTGAAMRAEAVRACAKLGRHICKAWSGYHRRSLVRPRCIASSAWASG